MTYYKVVKQGAGDLLHSVIPCQGGRLYYSKKKFTRMIPGSLGIFVFGELYLAEIFAKSHAWRGSPIRVFSCEIKGTAEKTRYVQDVYRSLNSFIKIFKPSNTRKKRIQKMAMMWFDKRVKRLKCAPVGTFTVQAVRLKRELRSFGYSWPSCCR